MTADPFPSTRTTRRQRLTVAAFVAMVLLTTLGSSPAGAVAPTAGVAPIDTGTPTDTARPAGAVTVDGGPAVERRPAATVSDSATTSVALLASPASFAPRESNATDSDDYNASGDANSMPGGDAAAEADEPLVSIELVVDDVGLSSRTSVLVGALGTIGVVSLVALWSVQRYNGTTLSDDRERSPRQPPDGHTAVRDCSRIVELLVENDGEMRQSRIVEVTDWSKAKVSRLLSRMEDRGTVRKESAGRQNVIVLERDGE